VNKALIAVALILQSSIVKPLVIPVRIKVSIDTIPENALFVLVIPEQLEILNPLHFLAFSPKLFILVQVELIVICTTDSRFTHPSNIETILVASGRFIVPTLLSITLFKNICCALVLVGAEMLPNLVTNEF
jgi:hypothetical protein